jgi:hypothetical protein
MYSVYQHWDPLKVCVVGRGYPPEYYSWITVPHVRELFERIAIETEEDFQNIIKKLQSFGVEVLRPTVPTDIAACRSPSGRLHKPPITPRDTMGMFGTKFYESYTNSTIQHFYKNVKDSSWPELTSGFFNLPEHIQRECIDMHGLLDFEKTLELPGSYDHVFEIVKQQGNQVIANSKDYLNSAMVARIGRDLFLGTQEYTQNQDELMTAFDQEFPLTRNHIINTGGHGDGTYCPVCPGLIISLYDVSTYADIFPGWEVVYLPKQSWDSVEPFINLKEKNKGKWWIPGFEHDDAVINVVEQWLGHWTGYVEETVFDVNMLIVDPKNVMVFSYNQQVFDALDRYGITPHIVPFRHRFFWDGGIHCVTLDLHREGTMQDYFPQRG